MNLQKLIEDVSAAGKAVALEAMENPRPSEAYSEAIMGLVLAKTALIRIQNERQNREFDAQIAEQRMRQIFGEPNDTPDSGAIPEGRGVARCTPWKGGVSGETQAHEPVSPE